MHDPKTKLRINTDDVIITIRNKPVTLELYHDDGDDDVTEKSETYTSVLFINLIAGSTSTPERQCAVTSQEHNPVTSSPIDCRFWINDFWMDDYPTCTSPYQQDNEDYYNDVIRDATTAHYRSALHDVTADLWHLVFDPAPLSSTRTSSQYRHVPSQDSWADELSLPMAEIQMTETSTNDDDGLHQGSPMQVSGSSRCLNDSALPPSPAPLVEPRYRTEMRLYVHGIDIIEDTTYAEYDTNTS